MRLASLAFRCLLVLLVAVPVRAQFWEAASSGITLTSAERARWVAATPSGAVLLGAGGAGSSAPGAAAGIYRSTDGGAAWTQTLSRANPRQIRAVGTDLYMASPSSGVWKSADDGVTWAQVNTGLTTTEFYVLTGTTRTPVPTVFAGAPTGVFRSVNGGTTWTQVNNTLDTNALTMGAGDREVWAGNYNANFDQTGLYYSPDLGQTWQEKGLFGERVNAILVSSAGVLYAGLSPGLFRSLDSGTTWTSIEAAGLDTMTVNDVIELPGGALWVGGEYAALVSTDGGATWAAQNSGVPNEDVEARALAFNPTDNRLYMAEFVRQAPEVPIYRSVLPVVATEDAERPDRFRLGAAYPNPFNPTTTLPFTLPQAADVTLKVYDVLGREVATLLDGPRPAGPQQVSWNAAALPSGVYLYRLTTPTFAETRRVTLVK